MTSTTVDEKTPCTPKRGIVAQILWVVTGLVILLIQTVFSGIGGLFSRSETAVRGAVDSTITKAQETAEANQPVLLGAYTTITRFLGYAFVCGCIAFALYSLFAAYGAPVTNYFNPPPPPPPMPAKAWYNFF